jgi:LysM repeat protein
MRPLLLLVLGPVVALCLLTTGACGGGDDGKGKGPRITDPALVPSATPNGNPERVIFDGDTIKVEGGPGSTVRPGQTAASNQPRSYTVKAGDNCASIAADNGITLEQLRTTNRSINADCSNLRIGDSLRIPGTTPTVPAQGGRTVGPAGSTPSPGRTYTVRDGDTCGDIAANQGVQVSDLIAKNNLDANCTSLKIGQVLQIP